MEVPGVGVELEELSGAQVIAEALREQDVQYMFGVVGIPVIEIAMAAQAAGIKYIGMRNEQAACYAASVVGYLTGRPGVCLAVSGPGLIHALGGMANANMNCWPVVVLAGSSDKNQETMGAFQEFPQAGLWKAGSISFHILHDSLPPLATLAFPVEACRLYSKFSARPSSLGVVPTIIEKAVRTSIYGRPGACYVDVPGDMVTSKVHTSSLRTVPCCPCPPLASATPAAVREAALIIKNAKKPLVVVGKGAAYSRAEECIRKLVDVCGLPFLPTPMGKGVVPDDHLNCVSAARSRALLNADVILLLGARLNWMLHFGHPPRFRSDVKIIQVDICAEELGNNVRPVTALLGDVKIVVQQLLDFFRIEPWFYPSNSEWWLFLKEKIKANEELSKAMAVKKSLPMNYYTVFHTIQTLLPKDCIIVSEGANTMDIGRTMLPNYLPRHRLDAGTFGTMGVGLGFAIAAALIAKDQTPHQRVICIEGDSAFGFSGMEVETMCRYNLPIVIIVVNNNGIYHGLDEGSWKKMAELGKPSIVVPPTTLLPNAHYEQVMSAFGGKGYFVQTPEELSKALVSCLAQEKMPSLINVMIDPSSDRKTQDFTWLTLSNM